MKNKLLLFLIVAVFAVACKKQDFTPLNSNTIVNNPKKSNSARDGIWDLLGYGYNITGAYAQSYSAGGQVLDIARFKADYPDRVLTDLSQSQTAEITTGTDALDYIKKISNNFSLGASDSAATFKATIKAAFKDSSSFSSKYAYSSYDLTIKEKRLTLNSPIDLMKSYANATFLTDVQNQSPAYIVSHYGTHVLTDIFLGAKLSVLYQSATTSSNRYNSSQAGLSFGIKTIFSIDASLNTTTSELSKIYSSKMHYETRGGDASKSLIGDIDLNTSNTPTVNISNWQSSATVQNAELIDIGTSGLVELSQFVSDPTKAQALHDYIVQYLINNRASLLPAPIYGYYRAVDNKHILSSDPNYTAISPNWRNTGVGFYAYTVQYGGTVPVYQYSNPNTGDHFYATNPNAVTPTSWVGYQRDGITFYGYPSVQQSTIPCYIFYSENQHDHIYSPNPNVTAGYPAGWVSHGIGFYVFPVPAGGIY
ncbi:MAC/perforin domain-containing protein [Mucilaginibacter sp. RS28]|uniref:MAC/perforin domain-containing protein n=1 Tax=Mucilaginibacter straminoryzae TaxID=2932774 RepID=A0A9X1X125_9SPHI|nr:MAC/perforin domain-containing protein [Mucilaginibacter straminoryzae]MCJ8208430.1 MAC/perforin domain-containing protein [Mucilaginibacter straminoryzae]